jgi:DNA-binding NtrC family response regulator
MSDISVVCIDDERSILDSIRDYFASDYRCVVHDDPVAALEYLRLNPVDILIADYRMPGLSGLDLLKEAKKLRAYETGLLLTAYADKELLKDALNNGLVDRALEKPLDLKVLRAELDAAARGIILRRNHEERTKEIYRLLASEEESGFVFIGKDGDLADLWRMVERSAPTEENVLITGATGTGKDVLARQIHSLSGRAEKPFIKINCGAIPPTLIESELFGHEKGAFSGADQRKLGKIELAHRGTLFLDEIGELPLELQSRLLHVVEDKSLERVGGTAQIETDFRLISATNRRPEYLRSQEFRRDLYYRISTVHLDVPDLASRRRDLPVHINALLRKNARAFGKSCCRIADEAMQLLCGYSWPGNIRELDNVLKRAILMKPDGETALSAADLTAFPVDAAAGDGTPAAAVDVVARALTAGTCTLKGVEQALLGRVVELSGGKIMEAARRTGIPKDRFYRLQDRDTS